MSKDGGGDKTMNAVFPRRGIANCWMASMPHTGGGPAVECQTPGLARQRAVQHRGGRRPERSAGSTTTQPKPGGRVYRIRCRHGSGPTKQGSRKDLQHFPDFATFGENRPYVIRLNALQVNLLANLASWSITNEATRTRIRSAFGDDAPSRELASTGKLPAGTTVIETTVTDHHTTTDDKND